MESQPRVALVTGGARRVGRAIVQSLAHAGFDVAFTWHTSQSQAEGLVAELSAQTGRRLLAMRADLTRPQEAVPDIARRFRDQLNRLDLLVNNASLYTPARLDQTDLDLIRRLMAIHVESPLLLSGEFADMLRAAGGAIVNLVDLLAEKPWPQYLAYCASKAALWNLTLGLARQLAPQVRVNAIAPGVVAWPDDATEQHKQEYLARVPLARAGSPEDVAGLVRFLATEGGYITGQIIRLDGGRSIT
jgi:pteridine reductase